MARTKSTRYLRIFQPDEFIRPTEWPDTVGLAVLVEDDRISQIHPFLSSEETFDMLVRIAPSVDRKYTKTPVIPKVKGVRTQSVPFSKSLEILRQLEKRIAEGPELQIEAENFEINFRYAMESGIKYEELMSRDTDHDHIPDDENEEDFLSDDPVAGTEDLRLPHEDFADAKIYFDSQGCATHLVTGDGEILKIGLNTFYIAENHSGLADFVKFDPEAEIPTLPPESEERERSRLRAILAAACVVGALLVGVSVYHANQEPDQSSRDPVAALRQEIFQD